MATDAENKNGDKLQALIADLEQSIASFDERFESYSADPAPVTVTSAQRQGAFPQIDAAAQRTIPSQATAATSPEPEPAPDTDLLSELAAAADVRRSSHQQDTRQRDATANRIDVALRHATRYFEQLSEHVNVLRPEIPTTYAIDTRHRFERLRWQESMVSTRANNQTERAHLQSLTVRIKYSAGDVMLDVPETLLERFSREMGLINLVWREDGIVDIPGHGTGRSITVSGLIPLQIAFTPDLDNQRIVMRCRNVIGLGLSAFAIAPEQLDQATLDAIARCLIGRGNKLPAHFRAVVAFDSQGNPR